MSYKDGLPSSGMCPDDGNRRHFWNISQFPSSHLSLQEPKITITERQTRVSAKQSPHLLCLVRATINTHWCLSLPKHGVAAPCEPSYVHKQVTIPFNNCCLTCCWTTASCCCVNSAPWRPCSTMRGPCVVWITCAVTHLMMVPGGWPTSSCCSMVVGSAPTDFSSAGNGADSCCNGGSCCCVAAGGASTVEATGWMLLPDVCTCAMGC